MINASLEQTEIIAGETLSGTLIWQASDSSNTPQNNVSVSIRWYTEGRGTTNHETVQELLLDPDRLISSQRSPLSFSFQIPHDGPITYNGSLICVIWELEVSIQMPGLLRRKDKQTLPFQVLPR